MLVAARTSWLISGRAMTSRGIVLANSRIASLKRVVRSSKSKIRLSSIGCSLVCHSSFAIRHSSFRFHGFQEHFLERAALRAEVANLFAGVGSQAPEQVARAAVGQAHQQQIAAWLDAAALPGEFIGKARRVGLHAHFENPVV